MCIYIYRRPAHQELLLRAGGGATRACDTYRYGCNCYCSCNDNLSYYIIITRLPCDYSIIRTFNYYNEVYTIMV